LLELSFDEERAVFDEEVENTVLIVDAEDCRCRSLLQHSTPVINIVVKFLVSDRVS